MTQRAPLPDYLKLAGKVSRMLAPLSPDTRRTVLDFLLKAEDEARLAYFEATNGHASVSS